MATAREILQLIITADGRAAVAEMRTVGAAARTELGAVEAGATRVRTSMLTMGAGMAAAGAGAIWALDKLSDAYIENGTQTLKLMRLTGGTAEDMSTLKFAAESSAVSVGTLTKGMTLLSKGSVSPKGKQVLEDLGVSLKDAQGEVRPTIDVLKDLSTAVADMPNGLQKNATAMVLFGRSGADMIPLLNKGGDGIEALMDKARELGLELTGPQAQALGAYRQSVRDLNEAKTSLKMAVGETVFPAFAKAMGTVAETMGTAARMAQSLPAPLRESAGTITMVAATALVAAGSLTFMAGAATKMSTAMRTSEGVLNGWGKAAKGISFAALVVGGSEMVFDWINTATNKAEQATDAINRMKLAASGNGDDPLAAFAEGVANEQNTLRFQNLWQEFGAEIELVGTGVKADVEQVQRYFNELRSSSPEAAGAALDALERATSGLDRNSKQYQINRDFIEKNRKSLKLAADATAAESDSLDDVGDSAETASRGLNLAEYSLRAVGDAASGSKSDLEIWIDTMQSMFDPVFGLMDANERLADAQKRMADAANTHGADVVAATKNLSDAQERLNKVLRDDPLFGLRQVPPEVDLADARNRLAEANRRLAANPRDADALTMRDEAVTDLEAANKRAQDMRRQAEQRAESINQARSGVADAQRQLEETQARHGVNSEEYQRASRDVVRANYDVEVATARLTNYLNTAGSDAVDKIKTKLDEWIAKGGPLGAAAAQMKTDLDPLVLQVMNFANQLDNSSNAIDRLNAKKIDLNMLGAAGNERTGGSSSTDSGGYWSGLWTGTKQMGSSVGGFLGSVGSGIWDGAKWVAGHSSIGGEVPGIGGSDSVPMMLTPGEYVIPKDAARTIGMGGLESLRHGRIPSLQQGRIPVAAPRYRVTDGTQNSVGGGVINEGSLTLHTSVTQIVRDDRAAGAALIRSLRDVAFRSGKGLRAANALEAVR